MIGFKKFEASYALWLQKLLPLVQVLIKCVLREFSVVQIESYLRKLIKFYTYVFISYSYCFYGEYDLRMYNHTPFSMDDLFCACCSNNV